MYIDESLCEECLDCRPVCPVGALRSEVLGEKVLSAIAEFIVPEARALDFIEEMREFLDGELDCVATMSVTARADDGGKSEFMLRLRENGIDFYPNGKVNIGMVPAVAGSHGQ
jgi:hypothetical protein